MTDDTFKLRSIDTDGIINEVEITPEQALDLGAGQPIAYFPHDERAAVDDDGQIIHRESARPGLIS